MLEVIQFQFSGRYGLQNTWTGVVLHDKNDRLLRFRTRRGAERYARRLTRKLNRTINNLSV